MSIIDDIADASSSHTPARNTEEMPATKEDRVQYCMRLMPHAWERGKTSKVIAKRWDCEVHIVEHAAAEAWRRLRAQDPAWVKPYLCGELQSALDDAKTIDDMRGKVSAVVEVVKAWAPLAGAQPAANGATINIINRPEFSAAMGDAMRVVARVLDCLHPGASADVGAGLQAWQTGGSKALDAWLMERAYPVLEASE